MITSKELDDLNTYQIPYEFYGFLKETHKIMEAGHDEGFAHLCSRFCVAHDNFVKRENPEVFALSRRDRSIRDTLHSIQNIMSHIHGAITALEFEIRDK